MADKSFALAPLDGIGFDRYTDIVRTILQAYKTVKEGIYNTSDNNPPKSHTNTAFSVAVNLTTPTADGPSGYNIDTNGATQVAITPSLNTLNNKFTSTEAIRVADSYFTDAVKSLQSHLVSLLGDSTSYTGSTNTALLNNYYRQNLRNAYRERTYTPYVEANLLNGGYFFNSDWQHLSARAGYTYSSDYDLG